MKWRGKRMSTPLKLSLLSFLPRIFNLIFNPTTSKTLVKSQNQQVIEIKNGKHKHLPGLHLVSIAAQFFN